MVIVLDRVVNTDLFVAARRNQTGHEARPRR
jgi:hypothetical protein